MFKETPATMRRAGGKNQSNQRGEDDGKTPLRLENAGTAKKEHKNSGPEKKGAKRYQKK